MNRKESLIFVSGLAIGSIVTWLALKNKYKEQAEEEIESAKEVYTNFNQQAIEKAAASRNKPDISIYTEALKRSREQKEEPVAEEEVEEEEKIEDEDILEPEIEEKSELEEPNDENYIYEITMTDFSNSLNGHTKITITCFADHIFADEMYDRLNPREYLSSPLVLLGSNKIVDPIEYIYSMPKDEICIRNYELKLDIDVVTVDRNSSDYIPS